MKLIRKIFADRSTNLTTILERDRLVRSMPGQTGALAASRLGTFA